MKRKTNRRASGDEFTALMEHYGLRSERGAELVAGLLYLKINTVQKAYQRGLLRTEYELLQTKLEKLDSV